MKLIKIQKGLNLKLKGVAITETSKISDEGEYAIYPEDFRGIKPRLLVKEGDTIEVGTPLFCNKQYPQQLYCAPVSGQVLEVKRGERRKIELIKIQSDGKQTAKSFNVGDIHSFEAKDAVDLLCETGLLFGLKQRPYDIVATPNVLPKRIFCSAFNKMPLSADLLYVISQEKESFQLGVTFLSKIAPICIGISPEEIDTMKDLQSSELVVFEGKNPSGNVGVQINHTYPINKGDVVWTIGPEELIQIGRFVKNGYLDFSRTIALAGSRVKYPHYLKIITGASLNDILKKQLKEEGTTRIISGNPLIGTPINANSYLRAFVTEITAIPEGKDEIEFMGWIRPRISQFSMNRSYFSWLFHRKQYDLDARIKGGERHMIMSGEYEKVFPMDIYPESLIKAILAEDIEKMENLGIYEVAPEDFALAEFVDSSKLELQRIVRDGLDNLRKENE